MNRKPLRMTSFVGWPVVGSKTIWCTSPTFSPSRLRTSLPSSITELLRSCARCIAATSSSTAPIASWPYGAPLGRWRRVAGLEEAGQLVELIFRVANLDHALMLADDRVDRDLDVPAEE